jgi:hypothetical protein
VGVFCSGSCCWFVCYCRTLYPAEADGSGHIRVGKLNLVDLAGSERQSKTGATGEHPWQQPLHRQTMCTAAEQSCTCRGPACCSCHALILKHVS